MQISDPTYVTVADVQAHTKVAGLADLGHADLAFLIAHAEDQIDDFCGPQPHHPYDDNVDRVFPREEDYRRTNSAEFPLEPEIPYQVSRACLLQVEYLYLNWWPNRETRQATVSHDVQSESIGGDGSYSATYAGLDLSAATLCPQAKAKLGNRFRSRSAQVGYANPRGSAALERSVIGRLSSLE